MSSFNGYPLFNDIVNPNLRAYNRANIFLNIKERYGSVPAQRYVKRFKRNDQLSIFTMMRRFHEDGFEQTRRDMVRNKEIV